MEQPFAGCAFFLHSRLGAKRIEIFTERIAELGGEVVGPSDPLTRSSLITHVVSALPRDELVRAGAGAHEGAGTRAVGVRSPERDWLAALLQRSDVRVVGPEWLAACIRARSVVALDLSGGCSTRTAAAIRGLDSSKSACVSELCSDSDGAQHETYVQVAPLGPLALPAAVSTDSGDSRWSKVSVVTVESGDDQSSAAPKSSDADGTGIVLPAAVCADSGDSRGSKFSIVTVESGGDQSSAAPKSSEADGTGLGAPAEWKGESLPELYRAIFRHDEMASELDGGRGGLVGLKRSASEQDSVGVAVGVGASKRARAEDYEGAGGAELRPDDAILSASAPRPGVLVSQDRALQSFACVNGTGRKEGRARNRAIADELGLLAKHSAAGGDEWRAMAYRKAAASIRASPVVIDSFDRARALPRVGERIARKVEEIVMTGRLAKGDAVRSDECTATLALFQSIWGVGAKTAAAWWRSGLRSLDDVRERAKLTDAQKVGLKYIAEFTQRIPRAEVAELEAVVRRHAVEELPGVHVVCCGSYRRGRATCGDVDILITHSDSTLLSGLLTRLLGRLRAVGFLTDDLVVSEEHGYMGVCRLRPGGSTEKLLDGVGLNAGGVKCCAESARGVEGSGDGSFGVDREVVTGYGAKQSGSANLDCSRCRGVSAGSPVALHRRLDIKVYPPEQFPFALLYFTGSDYFNRSMRLLAHKKGYSLSDKCIAPAVRAPRIASSRGGRAGATAGKETVVTGEAIQCATEREIFAILGMEYKEPWERNV